MKKMNLHKLGFTLIEVMTGVLILSFVFIVGFQAYNGILVGKVKLIESTEIQKQAFYFSEKFFEEIKKGGTIDYEEYFNRRVVGTGTTNGYYTQRTGFGNFGKLPATNDNLHVGTLNYGNGFYYCRSNDGASMTGTGCVNNFNDTVVNYSGIPQRYGEYEFQFVDFNYNADDDLGNEDGDGAGNIRDDQDDRYLGEGPKAFVGNKNKVEEIYLISADKTKRTLFRWNIKADPDYTISFCDTNIGGDGCQSTIEMLKLEGKDWGMDHLFGTTDADGTEYDGIIDTWVIDRDFDFGYPNGDAGTLGHRIAGSDVDNYWQELFSDKVNVRNVEFYAYPNKDSDFAFEDDTPETNVNPFMRIKMILTPAFRARKGIKGKIPEIEIKTTISLTDIYSQ